MSAKLYDKPVEVIDNPELLSIVGDVEARRKKFPNFDAAAAAAMAEIERRRIKFTGIVVQGTALWARGTIGRVQLRTINYSFAYKTPTAP